jgi:hypothetical protein
MPHLLGIHRTMSVVVVRLFLLSVGLPFSKIDLPNRTDISVNKLRSFKSQINWISDPGTGEAGTKHVHKRFVEMV